VPSERSFKAVGKALPRNEDRWLVTGRGRFSDDFTLPGQVWAAMVRSPHPHARIAAIDTAEAMAMPGVLGVYTGADVQKDGLTWISQTYRCIGAENLRKMLCCNSFSEVQESPDADRVYAEAV
jgi:CO/xanthine dehydrogenase Mo-binding subunit